MTAINKDELLKYIHSAIELETDIVAQTEIQQQYDNAMDSRIPMPSLKPLPKDPDMPTRRDPEYTGIIVGVAIGGLFLIMGIGMMGTTIPAFLNWLSIIVGCAVIIYPIYDEFIGTQKRIDEYYQTVYLPEKERITALKKTIEQQNNDALNINFRQITEWNEALEETHQIFQKHKQETTKALEGLYTMDYIYPKYRNLPALTSIYEYLMTGRCEELTGPHGAYNLYEDELRKDTVISQLNTVIENLEQIKQNQYMLYQQVKSIQENTNRIASELHQIKGHVIQLTQLSALTAYYAGLTERNTRITMYYHL